MAEFDFDKAVTAVTAKPKPFNIDAALGVAPEGGLAASAKQMVGQTIKGAGQLAADVAPTLMGDNAALRTGQEMIDANPTKVQGLRDIVESPWTAAKEAVGNALPSMGGIIGLRALGSGITALAPATGPAAPIVAGLGQAVSWGGPAAIAALPAYSGIRDEQKEAGLEGTTTQKLVAAGGSVLSGVVEMAGGPQTRLLNALSSGLKREAGESLTKAVGKEALKSGLEEAGEELVQSPIEQLASYQDPTTAKNIQDTLFGGAMGLIGGGVLGGGMQAIAQKFGDAPPTDQQGKDKAATEDVQGQSLSSLVGAPTIVSNGQAYFSSGNGEFIVAPVEKLTEHFAGGGSVDTFNTAQATQEQLDKVGKFSLGYLTELRNSDQALIQAGVNKKDVDALILSKVQDTPGRREYIASLLSSGRPDAQAVNEIGSGKIDSPNAPLQAEWMRQEEAAKVATANILARINDEQNRIAREQARIEEENRVIDYWRSIGAVDTVEEGRRLAALRAPFISPFTSPEGVTSPPVGELPPSAPAAAPSGEVSPQEIATKVSPGLTYDGAMQGLDAPLHSFTLTLPDGRQPSFSLLGNVTEEALKNQVQKVKEKFGAKESGKSTQAGGAQEGTQGSTTEQVRLRSVAQPGMETQGRNQQQEVAGSPAAIEQMITSAKSAREAARSLSTMSKDKSVSAIAKRLAVAIGPDVKVKVVNPGVEGAIPKKVADVINATARGAYYTKDRTAYLRGEQFQDFHGMNERTVLHELLHAATADRLKAGSSAAQAATDLGRAAKSMKSLHADVTKYFQNEMDSGVFASKYDEATQEVIQNAIVDVDELVSYGLSRAEFQNVLKTIPYKNTNETMFSQFTKLIRRLLGLGAKDQSALTSLIDMTDTLLSLPEPAVAVVNGQRVLRDAVEKGQPIDRILMEQAGQSITAAQDDVTSKIAAAAAGAKVEYAPRWLSVMPLHTLVQTVGTKIKQVKRVEDILNEAEHISESMVTESMQYYTNAQNSKQAEKINLVAGLASFYRVTPWKNIDAEVDWVPAGQKTRADKLKAAEDKWKAAGMDKSTGKSFVAAHTEAKRAFDALNPEAQKAYRAIVSHMQDIRQREKNNLRTFIEKATSGALTSKKLIVDTLTGIVKKDVIDTAFKGDQASISTVYSALNEISKNFDKDAASNIFKEFELAKDNIALKQQLLTRFNSTFNDVRGAYWPLSRIGDFRLEYVDLDGTKVVQFFESDAARRDEMQELQTSGVDQQSFRLSFKDKRPRGEVAIPIELMTQLSTAVRNQKLSEASNDDPGAIASAEAEAQEIIDEMNQIWLRWQPETSALKNSLRRQNVKGFDQDMLRAYIEYTRKHAGNIAWTEQGRKLEDTLKSLHTEIVEDRNSGQDPTFKGMVLNDLRARLQAMREAKVGPIASFLGKVGTMWYMTSPSIALVQMTQLPILTLPKLAVKYGLGKATSAMGKGLRMAFSKDYTKDKLFGNLEVDALHDWLRMTVTAEMLENKGKNPLADRQLGDKQLGDFLYTKEDIESRYKQLSPGQQRIFILREALTRNLLDISAAHEAYSLTQGKDPNSLTNKAFRLAMAPMRLSELASRKAAILSTMELSKEQGKGFFDTIKDVGEVVNDTLYSYSKANKPAFLQSGTARVLAMFQWYRIMTALRIGLMFKRSIAAETPEIRAAAQKEFIGILGMTALLAGTLGLPLAKTVFSALDALADDDEPRDSELEFRKWAAERFGPEFGKIFTHGLPAAAGLNLTKRIGLDNLYGFQSEPPPRLHGKELALWYAGSQLGPAFGVFQSAFQGYDLMSKGEYMKGLEAALPKPIKDGLKAMRVDQEGELTSMSGKRVIGGENLTGDAVLLMALGINPTEVEEAQTSSYAASKISVRISERRGRLIDGSVKAILGDGDRDAAREAMLEFNKKMPRFAITGGDIRSALRRYRMEELGAKSKRDKMVAMQYEIPSY